MVFGTLYGFGFFFGYAFAPLMHMRPVPMIALGNGVLVLAFALLVASYALRVWGSSYLRARTVWHGDTVNETLIEDGPFAYTLNPLYLANIFMAVGFGLLAPPAGLAFIVVGNVVFNEMLIAVEERRMHETMGAQFDAYCARVPQLLPRLMPAGVATHTAASLSEGLRSEIFFACLIAGAFAWIFTPHFGFAIFIALYAAGIGIQSRVAAAASC